MKEKLEEGLFLDLIESTIDSYEDDDYRLYTCQIGKESIGFDIPLQSGMLATMKKSRVDYKTITNISVDGVLLYTGADEERCNIIRKALWEKLMEVKKAYISSRENSIHKTLIEEYNRTK